MASLAELYKYYEILDVAKDKAGLHEKEFRSIMQSAKTGPAPEKRLASQFLVKFEKFFPSLKADVHGIMIELCEDSDVGIRRQAIKDIETLCRNSPELCTSTAEVLTSLLHSDDPTEGTLVQKGLVCLLKLNAIGTLAGMFKKIVEGEELVRERAITFLVVKMKILIADKILPKDIEEVLVGHCRKLLEDVSGTEFVLLMHLLTSLPSMSTLLGRQQLLDIVTEQAELGEPFQSDDAENIERLTQCIKEAMPLFSKNVHSTRFVEYICTQVLPVISEITAPGALQLLKLLAEMSIHTGDFESPVRCVSVVYSTLTEYMALPPAEGEDVETEAPKLEFSYVECLMYTFHQLARKCPEYLTAEGSASRLKDFRLRLQYLARRVQAYIKTLRESLIKKPGGATVTPDNERFRTLALKTTSNINSLIKDLFYNPPAYKAIVILSFKANDDAAKSPEVAAAPKRPAITPITFDVADEPVKKNARPAGGQPGRGGGATRGSSGRGGFVARGQGSQRGRGGRGFKKQW